jgi:signal transduction histidine kinase
MVPAAAAKDIALTAEAAHVVTSFDRDRMMQVMSNLVGNAVKFTPQRGAIAIRSTVDDRSVTISVRDSGPGIPESERAHVFERYWKGPRSGALGLGLGLAIAKGIVEAHGGTIQVENVSGGGAVFTFTLPRLR